MTARGRQLHQSHKQYKKADAASEFEKRSLSLIVGHQAKDFSPIDVNRKMAPWVYGLNYSF